MREESLLYHNICMHMCRLPSVNKFHYAILCVHATFFYRNAIPPLRNVWDRMGTASCRGIPGRDIPIDHLIEKTNKAAKSMLRGIITKKRLRELIPTLNFLLPAEAEYVNLTGTVDEDRECFSGKQSRLETAKAVQSDSNSIIGESWAQCCQPVESCTFQWGQRGAATLQPWVIVTRSCGGWAECVQEKSADIERGDGRFSI